MKARDFIALEKLRTRSSRFAKRPLKKVPRTIQTLLESLRVDAERGDAAATTGLAYLYSEFSIGPPGEGLRLYKKAMAMGEPGAYCAVGFRLFDQGSRQRGLELIEKASEFGVTDAQVRLGYIYMYGKGAKRDLGRAEQLFQRAWRRGNPDAAFWLGVKRELIDRRPPREAAIWYERAATGAVPSGMVGFAGALETGVGVPQDRKAALRWYEKAASLGDRDGKTGARRLRAAVRNRFRNQKKVPATEQPA